MFTTVEPEKAIEIENQFRAVRTVGEFVAAVDNAISALHPGDDPVSKANHAFNKALNDAIIAALGADYQLKPIPDVALLIDTHASLSGTVDGLLTSKYENAGTVQ